MASGPITLWHIDEETIETVTDFISWAPKSLWTVTAAMKFKDACSLEEKLQQTQTMHKKATTTLPTKVCIVKAMVFPVVMCDVRAGP